MKIIRNGVPFEFSLRNRGHLQSFLDLVMEENRPTSFTLEVEYNEEENNFLLDICGAGFRDLSCNKAQGEDCGYLITELMCLAGIADQFLENPQDRFGVRIPQTFSVTDTRGNLVGRL